MNSCRQRRLNPLQIKKLQQGFVNSWSANSKISEYNAFEDKHNKCFFKLPNIKTHLKKLKTKMKQEPSWTENTQIIKDIQKQRSSQKKQKLESLADNLQVYIDDYIKHFNKGKITPKTNLSNWIQSKDGRYKIKKHQRSATRTNNLKPDRTIKTVDSNLSHRSVNHETFIQYIKKKKEQIVLDLTKQEIQK